MILYRQEKLTLARYELQEVVILLSLNSMERFRKALAGLEEENNRMFGIKLITQIGFILTSKTEHLFDAFGITTLVVAIYGYFIVENAYLNH